MDNNLKEKFQSDILNKISDTIQYQLEHYHDKMWEIFMKNYFEDIQSEIEDNIDYYIKKYFDTDNTLNNLVKRINSNTVQGQCNVTPIVGPLSVMVESQGFRLTDVKTYSETINGKLKTTILVSTERN